MRIGVISEGHADRAVISNILMGLTDIEASDIIALRPIYNYDETDKAALQPENFSSWSIIKEECESKELIEGFLAFEDQSFVAIHIDSAEASEYGINRPSIKKSDIYCMQLRELIINKIGEWFNDEQLHNQILHAIAVEEIDAWVMTIYDANKSCSSASPKEKLSRLLRKRGIKSTSNYDNYLALSKPFSKAKQLRKGNFLSYNCSLKAFSEEIVNKVLPKLI
ncbi:hypothetical protein [Chryseobacterium sp. ISL-6]|uniref:hypothetical protein n=1 Tax=Chryseobacterium sp. ISL-6 TaxID=2819143 RepID=UPI001BEC7423|nr:hypothetical protein [Chryseobacterium sp. ISL-6]MBT2623516.1 hypothetical protein [Chryseobacterium sp. ISL-6]